MAAGAAALAGSKTAGYMALASGVLGGIGSSRAKSADIKARGTATRRAIESSARATKYSQFQDERQLERINEIMGDRLSASGMERMQREARLKAASAETGGEPSYEVINTALVEENFRNAVIVRDATEQQVSTKMNMIAKELDFKFGAQNEIWGMQTPTSAGLQGFTNVLQGFQGGMNLFTNTAQILGYGGKGGDKGLSVQGVK